ncbi:helix-turn-helix transcriptional regulator [Pseudoalteromonas sp. Of7M-16]|uniref:helix-turn-helix domain-containing protein n=1 Tax=Pseudoalteromonas sp. Of7M-16 TaxID=2917756 RepID=UPI001EF44322|nr:helix-turn-helix transcriptional regulator [Pseudoalteromonas sp. Of7M-16]MCG7551722.1 helix-turn-helix transcriptional regulator [Pseudoalteromonas sp. Of7M-16]
MVDPIEIILTMVIVGQVCISVPILLSRVVKCAMNLPLALFLFASGVLALNSTIASVLPDYYALYTAFAFPVLFLLSPSLWFYVEGLTADSPWQLHKKQLRHYVLIAPTLLISVMIIFLPKDIHNAIFILDEEVNAPFVSTLLLGILIMMLLWLIQCAYTLIKIVRRLNQYRKKLKDVYSNHDKKELNWMNWLLFILVSVWLSSLVTVFSSSLFDHALFNSNTEMVLSVLLIWCITHFGLQQKPALADLGDEDIQDMSKDHDNPSDDKHSPTKKYQRSALGQTQSARIATKINSAMEQDKLYLDSNLSLQKLSKHLNISPNYISQTLNETLSVSFFDFVNQWRIEAAKPKILANNSTVLDIALEVGFNARSSFYKAFKQATGQTPSEFRKGHASS